MTDTLEALPPAEEITPHPLPGPLPPLEHTEYRTRHGVERYYWPARALVTPALVEILARHGLTSATGTRALTAEAVEVLETLAAASGEWHAFREGLAEALALLDRNRSSAAGRVDAYGVSAAADVLRSRPDPATVEDPAERAEVEALRAHDVEAAYVFPALDFAEAVAPHDAAVSYGRAWLAAIDAAAPPPAYAAALAQTLADLRRSTRARSVLGAALRESLPAPVVSTSDAAEAAAWLGAAYAVGARVAVPSLREAYVSAGSPGSLDRDGSHAGALLPALQEIQAVRLVKVRGVRLAEVLGGRPSDR